MPISNDKWKQFQQGFNKSLGDDETEEEKKKREEEERQRKLEALRRLGGTYSNE